MDEQELSQIEVGDFLDDFDPAQEPTIRAERLDDGRWKVLEVGVEAPEAAGV